MNLLLYREIADGLEIPDFGTDFSAHLAGKTHPNVRSSSISAWNLLACGLSQLGYKSLPTVAFMERGKPVFTNSPLYFSISHSRGMAAALISEAPCAVDVEIVRPDVSDRMIERCLSEEEKRRGCDFFEIWTKKECIAKLDGSGMPSRPSILDTLDQKYQGLFYTHALSASSGEKYFLTAMCSDGETPQLQKNTGKSL